MMLALIKKDLRVFLVPTVGGVVLISCGYLTAIVLSLFGANAFSATPRYVFPPVAVIGMMVVVLLAAAYGGCSFSVERREHSSDWLNMLPVTRGRIILSKIAASFACLAVLWLFDVLPIMLLWAPSGWIGELRYDVFLDYALGAAGSSCVLFGLAWLFSTFLESAAFAACSAIAITFALMLLGEGIHHLLAPGDDSWPYFLIVLLVIAPLASFLLGTYYYLNRVEP